MGERTRKIVVGFDGSVEARDALHLGSALAKSLGAQMIVAAASRTQAGSETKRFVAVFDRARAELPNHDFAMRELRDVSAPAGLSDIAASEEADLVVIGSTHRSKLGRAMPGSVGERLLSRAPCAVVVAPRGFADAEHFGLGLTGVAIDGSRESELALGVARDLCGRLDASLRVITIVPDGNTETLEAVIRDRAEDIQERARAELPASLDAEFVVEEGEPAAALARHGVDLDLLVIGSRGYGPVRRTLLGGVSADIMRTAPCPVLVVPRTASVDTTSAFATLPEAHGAR